jgi:hypothetical protein
MSSPNEHARDRLDRILAGQPDFVGLGAYGYAAVVDDAYEAYGELCATPEILAQLRPTLESMAGDASASARIYAALLLKTIDEPAGIAALESMVDALEPCQLTTGGCTGMRGGRLGEVALFLLGTARPTLATLHSVLDRLADLRDELPLDTDEPMLFPFLPAIAGHSPEQLEHARARIEQLLDNERPAPRVLAALALGLVDREAGQRALCKLATDKTEIWLGRQEGEVYLTVGELVRRFIDRDVAATLPPKPARPDPTLSFRPRYVAPTRWQRFWDWFTSLG